MESSSLEMIFRASPSQNSAKQLTQQAFKIPNYATAAAQSIGVVQYPVPADTGPYISLEDPTASSINAARQTPVFCTSMPPKRSASEDANGGPSKQVKTEQPEEFSNAVKKKLQSSSRTGQACDRCKVR